MEPLKEVICMFREQKQQARGRARPDRQNRRVKPRMNANEHEQENPPFGWICHENDDLGSLCLPIFIFRA